MLEHPSHFVGAGHFDVLAHVYDQLGVPPELLYFLRKARALVLAQLDVLFHLHQLLVDALHFSAPLHSVYLGLYDLVFLGLVIGRHLLLVQRRVKKVDFSLVDVTRLLVPVDLAGTLVFTARQMALVSLSLDLNAVQLLRAVQVRVVFEQRGVVVLQKSCVFLRLKLGREKLVLAPEQLHVEQFIDQVADDFAVAEVQVLGLAVARHADPELAQVVDQLRERLADAALEVPEVDKNAELLGLP